MNFPRTPFSLRLLAVLALCASSLVHAASDPLRSALEQSRDDKHGVTLVVGGRDVGLLVVEIGDEFVIGKSQQYQKIVVRIDRIDAVLQ